MFAYTPNYPWVHWHPPWIRAIGLSDISITGILRKVCILIEDHATFKSAGWRNGIEDKAHFMVGIDIPGSHQCWIDEMEDGLLDLRRICNIIRTPLSSFILLVSIISVPGLHMWTHHTNPQP